MSHAYAAQVTQFPQAYSHLDAPLKVTTLRTETPLLSTISRRHTLLCNKHTQMLQTCKLHLRIQAIVQIQATELDTLYHTEQSIISSTCFTLLYVTTD
jgi:hypothetical protein